MIPSPRDPIFGPLPLPGHFHEFRENQWFAIQETKERFESGDDVVFLEAPTGSGKSLIGETVRRLFELDALYCCTTKALQDQFKDNFEYGQVLKGRSNYLTELGNVNEFGQPHDRSWSAITCADCTYDPKKGECNWCGIFSFCPFQVAKRRAREAQLAILNTSLFLNDAQHSQNFNKRGLVIIDEADLLEEELMGQVEVDITPSRLEKLGISPPRYRTKQETWKPWIGEVAIPNLDVYVAGLPKPWEEKLSARDVKELNACRNLRRSLRMIEHELEYGGWVYDGQDDGHVIFRPVRVHRWGEKMIWPHGKKFLLMSATILSADLMADELGLYLPYAMVTVPSSFDPANRPIYVVPIANMSFKNKERGYEDMIGGVRAVLERHPRERVLVHTVSYELARFLRARLDDLDRPLITYTSSQDKGRALLEYKRKAGAVLFAPSMGRGVDLPDELCRVQVVAKIDFLSLKDKQVSARLYSTGGTLWYRMKAIRSLIQMTGRGIRHKDDRATTYILDEQFVTNLWTSDYLFPEWWKEAVIWRMTSRQLLGGR